MATAMQPLRLVSASMHHMYLIPGMFGFGRLAGYDYFEHIERAMNFRLGSFGTVCRLHVVPTPPTASIRRRARVLADEVARTDFGKKDHIHFVGHSTGGLDGRLLASPSVHFGRHRPDLSWLPRLRSVITINTPHYGTPLAQFFTTVSGARMLYALSLLTFTTLRFGSIPLTILSTVLGTMGKSEEPFVNDSRMLKRSTNVLLRFVARNNRQEVRNWLDGILKDQGGILQITPESMDIFNAAADDAKGVQYGCVATHAPAPSATRIARGLSAPYRALSSTIYSTLHTLTAREPENYPYPIPDPAHYRALREGLNAELSAELNDGIIPTLSMLWGKLLWCGTGDHLDVLGHFADEAKPATHNDWLASGANFSRESFRQAVTEICKFQIESTK